MQRYEQLENQVEQLENQLEQSPTPILIHPWYLFNNPSSLNQSPNKIAILAEQTAPVDASTQTDQSVWCKNEYELTRSEQRIVGFLSKVSDRLSPQEGNKRIHRDAADLLLIISTTFAGVLYLHSTIECSLYDDQQTPKTIPQLLTA